MAGLGQILGGLSTALSNADRGSRGEELLDPVGDAIRANTAAQDKARAQSIEDEDRVMKRREAQMKQQEHTLELTAKFAEADDATQDSLLPLMASANIDVSAIRAGSADDNARFATTARQLSKNWPAETQRNFMSAYNSAEEAVTAYTTNSGVAKIFNDMAAKEIERNVFNKLSVAKERTGREQDIGDLDRLNFNPQERSFAMTAKNLQGLFKQPKEAQDISTQVDLSLRAAGVKEGEDPTPEQAQRAFAFMKGGGQVQSFSFNPETGEFEAVSGTVADIDKFLEKQRGKEQIKFEAKVEDFKFLDNQIQEALDILETDPDINTLGADIGVFANTLLTNAQSTLAPTATGIVEGDDGQHLRAFMENPGTVPKFFSDKMVESQSSFKGLMFGLAIDAARVLADSTGRALSDADVTRWLKNVGANLTTAPLIRGRLGRTRKILRARANAGAKAFKGMGPIFEIDGESDESGGEDPQAHKEALFKAAGIT